jgi:hypothetical protein
MPEPNDAAIPAELRFTQVPALISERDWIQGTQVAVLKGIRFGAGPSKPRSDQLLRIDSSIG